MKKWLAMFCLAALISARVPAARAEEASSCVSCHAEEKGRYHVDETGSMHQRAEIGCVDCHGGDAKAADKDAAHSADSGFTGKIEKIKITELCGDCHADVRRMNPYGLPTDQLAQYRTSRHGEMLFGKGDPDVAACVDCHGAHGIIDIQAPESPVYPLNVPATCGHCHADEDKMSRHGLQSDQEAKYRLSVHAHLLFDMNDLSAPTCATCHGNHGAVPPGFAKVETVCGKCHIKQKEYFDEGPHAAPARKGDIEACVTCHGNHKVLPADLKLFRVCTLCHNKGEEPYERAKSIYTLLDDTRKKYAEAEETLDAAAKKGFLTEDEEVMMADAKTYLTQLAPLQHTMDLTRLGKVSDQVIKTSDGVESAVARIIEAARLRKLALIPLSAFMLIMSFGFWLKKRGLRGKGHD